MKFLPILCGAAVLTALAACGSANSASGMDETYTAGDIAEAFGRTAGVCSDVTTNLDRSVYSQDADEVKCSRGDDLGDGMYVAVVFDAESKTRWCDENRSNPNEQDFFEGARLFGPNWFANTFAPEPDYTYNALDDIEVAQDMLGGKVLTGDEWCG